MIVTDAQARVLERIIDERHRQRERWGEQPHNTHCQWLTIITEEVGEAARHAIELEHDAYPHSIDIDNENEQKLRIELVQLAAVVIAWLERLEP
jgi:NTP pyrophosphatase (non-canonical NTP hydrolase)